MIHSIKEWFKAAKPNPSTADACVQISCHYDTAIQYQRNYSWYLGAVVELSADARVELLNSICDQIVTAVGVAYMMGMDIEGALKDAVRAMKLKDIE